jgi:hypothetical protein
MKPGDLRRFHDDAFFANEKDFNGKYFVPLEWWSPHDISILADGQVSRFWVYQILVDHSEPIDETR